MTNFYSLCGFILWLFLPLLAAAAKADSEAVQTVVNEPLPARQLIVRTQEVQALPESLQKYMKKKKVDPQTVSIFVRDVNADLPLLQYNSDVPRNPASTMKVVTTWGALKVLGPAWSWDTEAWLRGELQGDVLQGDLVLKGYGDPFLVYETFWQLVHELRQKGIREISGDLILDDSFFEVPDFDPGAFDNQPTRVYNASPAALMFNFNATRFLFSPDAAAGSVNISTLPPLNRTMIDNQLELVSGRCRGSHLRPVVVLQPDGKLLIRGKFADSCGQRVLQRLVSSPQQHVFNAFKSFWEDQGGYLGGGLQTGRVQATDTRFHVHTSRPLAEQVRLINKWSNNVMTRHLMLSTGAKRYGAPATLEKGRLAVMDVLRQQGVPTTGIFIDNGSGLSRDARISADQLGTLLQAIWHDPYMPELLNSLPLLGEDGTLARRFRNSVQKGRSRLKTGTLRNVAAIAGYMLTRSGKRMVIVMQQNGRRAGSVGQALQDQLLEWVFEQ
ncbi:MAG: D-alanyl-D-alanine carboxypeptidase/D-alanyl-D-alanine-endopeptidase [Thiothrix nivea]|nr:MAG: D-alanyl-D-alanine carboxypeptidase/D-alanyl-D-alanine-endopeptidase [Thiothrix nivea]